MKLRYVLLFAGAAVVVGCSQPSGSPSGDRVERDSGWIQPPRIEAVRATNGGLAVTGTAPPGARVVLRGQHGAAFAAGADAGGQFEVRVDLPSAALLLTPEVQRGQTATPASDQLLLPEGGRGATALLAAGGASRRLDPGPALDAVDGDGRGLVASGRAQPAQVVLVGLAGGGAAQIRAGPDGRWTAVLPGARDQPTAVRVGAAVFAYPGPGAAPVEGQVRIERAGQGVRVMRSLSSTARQTSWFPDGQAVSP